MSDSPTPEIEPDTPRPAGDVSRSTRRRASPKMIALAALLAVLITAVGAALLALVVWAAALAVH
ncbi:MAG TPA: hypothetical protein VIJ94_18005 [Caulobacteraceae bacterium]